MREGGRTEFIELCWDFGRVYWDGGGVTRDFCACGGHKYKFGGLFFFYS